MLVVAAARRHASAMGAARYCTGKPCKRGHICERWTKSGDCVECSKARYTERPESFARASKKWREKNAEWTAQNRQRINENSETYRRNNLALYAMYRSKRRAQEKRSTPPWFSDFDRRVIADAFLLARQREIETGEKWEVDHTIPLAGKDVCGLHIASNIQVIPRSVNRRKSNRFKILES